MNRFASLFACAWGMLASTAHAALAPVADFVTVKAGASYNLALRSDGSVWSWGSNSVGELGDDTTNPRFLPGTPKSDQLNGCLAARGAGGDVVPLWHPVSVQRRPSGETKRLLPGARSGDSGASVARASAPPRPTQERCRGIGGRVAHSRRREI
jgi:hypothetical protein